MFAQTTQTFWKRMKRKCVNHDLKPAWKMFLNNPRSSRVRSVFSSDNKDKTYSVLEVNRKRYHRVRSAIELLAKKQKAKTNFPRKEFPYVRNVVALRFDEIPAMLTMFQNTARASNEITDVEDLTENDKCLDRWTKHPCDQFSTNCIISHGIEVDAQIGMWCEQFIRYAEFDKSASFISFPSTIRKGIAELCPDPCTVKTLKLIWDGLELRPVAVQFPVFNNAMKVAMKIDVVARDRRGDELDCLWIMETKCSNAIPVEYW